MSTILPAAPGMATKADATDREKLHTVAKQFEAVFVREMLSAARKSSFGGEGGAGDISGGQALDTFRQLQDENVADATVQSGVLGLAKILEEQMAKFVGGPSTSSGRADVAGNGSTTKKPDGG
ncbi:rod-binding protein [Novosphingobium sp. P6W]|uniref:rod-binding protein n=1 Tax=Novosphingobium sp. P6W TaxID=1609758 RepID=UPI0005C539C2|nr:rod-binding protein [Novosphingobium sp. P6W]AXB75655.1 flagellar biosynthesis protein FlgJ [Novosphingobium sp. P6W]